MNDLDYSDAFHSLRCNMTHGITGAKRLAEVFRICNTDIPKDDPVRGLRVLAIGAGHGKLLDETFGVVGDDVNVDCLDCVEPNSVMMIELQPRMSLLASKYNFKYKLYQRHFTRKNAPSYLPNDFYDLLIFSHVLYYFEDPARELEFGLHKLTHKHGRAFVDMALGGKHNELEEDIDKLLGSHRKNLTTRFHVRLYDIQELLTNAKTKTVWHGKESSGILTHLSLMPVRAAINETDIVIRKMGVGIMTFLSRRNFENLSDDLQVQIQDIFRKHSVESHGFPILPLTIESFLLIRE